MVALEKHKADSAELFARTVNMHFLVEMMV